MLDKFMNNIIHYYNIKILLNYDCIYTLLYDFSFYNIFIDLVKTDGKLFLRLELVFPPYEKYLIDWNRDESEFTNLRNKIKFYLYNNYNNKSMEDTYEYIITQFIKSSLCSKKCIEEYYSLI